MPTDALLTAYALSRPRPQKVPKKGVLAGLRKRYPKDPLYPLAEAYLAARTLRRQVAAVGDTIAYLPRLTRTLALTGPKGAPEILACAGIEARTESMERLFEAGASVAEVARQFGCPRKVAKAEQERLFAARPEIPAWQLRMAEMVERQGYVVAESGFRLHGAEPFVWRKGVKQFGHGTRQILQDLIEHTALFA